MTDSRICLVLSPDFGERLRALNLSTPIWIVQSKENDPVTSALWQAKAGNVTSFRSQEFGQLVDTVDLHHPDWRELEVHGLTSEKAEFLLSDYGNGTFTTTEDGFLFRWD